MSNTTVINLPSTTPVVLDNITTDIQDAFTFTPSPGFNGTVIPSGNNIVLTGDNGIVTVQNTNDDSQCKVRFIQGSAHTVNALNSVVFIYDVPTNASLTLSIMVSGFSTDNKALGGSSIATVKNVAGTATVLGTPDIVIDNDPELAGATFTITTAANTVVITAVGVAGHTIDWGFIINASVSSLTGIAP